MSGYLDLWRTAGQQSHPGRAGSLPAPLDAVDRALLVGAHGSHPLAFLEAAALLRPATDGFSGGLVLDAPARVGGEIRGRLRARALRAIDARGARLAVKGYLLCEVARSETRKDPKGAGTTEYWVEVVAREIGETPLTETPLPTRLEQGEEIDLSILAPAPQVGPPSAHVGSAAVIWTLQATWDLPLAGDERIAAIVPVGQHPDLIRSGVIGLGPSALLDSYASNGATIDVRPAPPIAAGSSFDARVAWPGVEGGRGARVELHVDIEGGGSVRLAATNVATAELAGGVDVRFDVPADAPPVCDAEGISVRYRIRALVDRPMRPDLAAERNIAIF
ncbi:MAG: hypothetical protein RLZZ432_276 [Chloroflexota bacterium]